MSIGFWVAINTPTPKARACFISAADGALGGLVSKARGQVAVNLVEGQQRTQALQARQGAHPREHLLEQPGTSARSSSSRWATLTITDLRDRRIGQIVQRRR